MYKDIINYQLADDTTEEHLIRVAQRIFDSWMSKQPGFIKWEIHLNEAGGYTDIVYWESKDAAKKAEAAMKDIPNAGEWYQCYQEGSIKSEHLQEVANFA